MSQRRDAPGGSYEDVAIRQQAASVAEEQVRALEAKKEGILTWAAHLSTYDSMGVGFGSFETHAPGWIIFFPKNFVLMEAPRLCLPSQSVHSLAPWASTQYKARTDELFTAYRVPATASPACFLACEIVLWRVHSEAMIFFIRPGWTDLRDMLREKFWVGLATHADLEYAIEAARILARATRRGTSLISPFIPNNPVHQQQRWTMQNPPKTKRTQQPPHAK